MKLYRNSILIIAVFACNFAHSQDVAPDKKNAMDYCIKNFDVNEWYDYFIKIKATRQELLNTTSYLLYHGNDLAGNMLQQLILTKMDSISADDYQSISVQHTKNGNYETAINFLEKAIVLDTKVIEDYYGWLLLYYYRDYTKALKHLTHFDGLTPNFIDAPVGENIHFLKGLCYYQLNQYSEAINEFKKNETFEIERFGEKNCNGYIYFYKARCYDKLNKKKEAELEYYKAIKNTLFPTEANYYLGLLYLKNGSKIMSKRYLDNALHLINKGYKQQDIYVELFDEVYKTQIVELLNSF